MTPSKEYISDNNAEEVNNTLVTDNINTKQI